MQFQVECPACPNCPAPTEGRMRRSTTPSQGDVVYDDYGYDVPPMTFDQVQEVIKALPSLFPGIEEANE